MVCPAWNYELVNVLKRPERIVQVSEVDAKGIIRLLLSAGEGEGGQAASSAPLQAASSEKLPIYTKASRG